MKKCLIFGSAVLILAFATACGTARLDEKLDEEYMQLRSDAVSDVREIDSLYKHIQSLVRTHNNEDTRIDNKALQPVDVEIQKYHNTWITDLQPTLVETDNWLASITQTLTKHDSLEVFHDEASASDIKSNHTAMREDIISLVTEAEKLKVKLDVTIDTLKSFLREHGELRDKYDITIESTEQPVYK